MFEKNQYKNFMISNDGFSWKGEQHFFIDIAHIFYKQMVTAQRLNFIKVGEYESAGLRVILTSGNKIDLSFDEGGFVIGWNFDKKTDLKNLFDLYSYLCKETFQNRISSYLKQVEAQGYFTIDECKFYPKEKIVFRTKEFLIHETSFLRYPGYIELQRKDSGIFGKIKREVQLTKIPQFSTLTDTDVVFTLLNHYFGLRWK